MGAVVKGALGAVVIAVAGFFGTAMMNVLSAPKDSVAYDLIQSMTGMLKGGQQQTAQAPAPAPAPAPAAPASAAAPAPVAPAPVAPQRAAAPQPSATAQPAAAPVETKVATASPMIPGPEAAPAMPRIELPPPPASAPSPAPSEPSRATAPAGSSTAEPAPSGSMLDRVRQTREAIEKARANTAALMATRVLTLQDKAETPICGKTWRLEVTSIEAGRAQVALRGADGGGQPLTLSVGAPRPVSGDCRVELLMAYEDLTTRRAQLRETKAP